MLADTALEVDFDWGRGLERLQVGALKYEEKKWQSFKVSKNTIFIVKRFVTLTKHQYH